MADTVIFDLDGTLLNTLDDLADSMNYALRQCNFPERSKNEIKKAIGGGADVLVSLSVPKDTPEPAVEGCKKIFLQHYMKNNNNKTGLYAGIEELVQSLFRKNIKMGVVSSKGDKAVKQLIQEYFGEKIAIALGDMPGVRKKPAPDSLEKAMEFLEASGETTLYVGDSEVDVETARNAGIPCILVTWGFRDREELEKREPDYLVDSVQELEEIILSSEK